MKNIIKRSFLMFFIGLIAVVFFYGCAGMAEKTGSAVIKVKGGKEILVARTYSRSGDDFYTLKWCGNSGYFSLEQRQCGGYVSL